MCLYFFFQVTLQLLFPVLLLIESIALQQIKKQNKKLKYS